VYFNCLVRIKLSALVMEWGQDNSEWNDAEANKLPEKVEELKEQDELPKGTNRKKIVVVGLGMVGIAFM